MTQNKKRMFMFLIMGILCLLLPGCSKDKYMLSGTWYQAGENPVTWVFYESGRINCGQDEGTYEADSNGIVIYINNLEMSAALGYDNRVYIECAQTNESIILYKDYNTALQMYEQDKEDDEKKAMTELSGKWQLSNGNAIAFFEDSKLTMITTVNGKEIESSYCVVIPEEGIMQLTSGNEIVDEFEYAISENELIFTNEDTTLTYFKIEQEKQE